jgi:V/A-type H+-transporting ATPase subunit C
MKPIIYKEIMPKVAIENLKLIELNDIICLIGRDLESIRSALLESPYQTEVLTISKDKIDSISLEEALLENYVKTIKNLIKFSSGNIRRLLLAVLKKFEVSNIKAMLRAVKVNMPVDEAVKHIVPVGTLDRNGCRAILVEAETIDDVINSLLDLEYGLIMKSVLTEGKTIEDLLPLEVALDKAVYQGILKSASKLKGLDKKIAKNVLGIEMDAINIKIILRLKAMGISQDQMGDYLIPTFLINEKALEDAMKVPNIKSVIESLLRIAEIAKNSLYQNILLQMLEEYDKPLSRLEAILDKASLEACLDILKEYTRYYNIGFILAFLNLKWFEVRNLRSIIIGSERKVPASQVKELLTLPDGL